jgi:hypothetical protein
VDLAWFGRFFGEPLDSSLTVYLSLVNGPSNYAVPNGVLMGMSGDMEGLPYVDEHRTLPVLIHEFGHHYVNPIAASYRSQMEKAAGIIFPKVESRLNMAGYGDAWTMTVEWLNELCVLMYFKEANSEWLAYRISVPFWRGFIWMERSVGFMENFYADRERYPYMHDFMPQLVLFFNYIAEQIEIVYTEFMNCCPFIVSTYPAVGSDITGFDKIVITFSEPMMGSHGDMGIFDENIQVLPYDWQNVTWSDDMRQATLPLITDEIEENSIYGLQLASQAYCSARYFPLNKKCTNLIFNTIVK